MSDASSSAALSKQHRDSAPKPHAEQAWFITNRWQAFEGEIRCGILRVVFLAILYLIQLIHFQCFSSQTAEDVAFHREVTWLATAWLFASIAILLAMKRHFFPQWIGVVSIVFDVALLTTIAMLGSHAASPLVAFYFLLIAMAGLRASLPSVWIATISSVIGYLVLVGTADQRWFDQDHVTPIINQFVTLAGIVGTGIVVGQMLRMNQAAALAYRARVQHLSAIGESREETHD